MSKFNESVEKIGDKYIFDLLSILESKPKYEKTTEEEEDLGTEDDQEEIADEEGEKGDEDVEEAIKGTATKQGKMSTADKKKAEIYRRKNKAKLAKAEKKRSIENKARDARNDKKKEMLKKQGKDDKYTIDADGNKVKKKTRRN